MKLAISRCSTGMISNVVIPRNRKQRTVCLHLEKNSSLLFRFSIMMVDLGVNVKYSTVIFELYIYLLLQVLLFAIYPHVNQKNKYGNGNMGWGKEERFLCHRVQPLANIQIYQKKTQKCNCMLQVSRKDMSY